MTTSTKEDRRCRECRHQAHPGKKCTAPVDATMFDPPGTKPRCQCRVGRNAPGDPS